MDGRIARSIEYRCPLCASVIAASRWTRSGEFLGYCAGCEGPAGGFGLETLPPEMREALGLRVVEYFEDA